MVRLLISSVCLALLAPAAAMSESMSKATVDARMNAYFATWSDNRRLNEAEVARFYTDRVDYYGRLLDRAGVLRAKLSVARQWPRRVYRVAPGSVRRACGRASCSIEVVLDWRVANAAGGSGSAGSTSVSLTLVEQDGAYKIAAENGRTLAR